MAQFNLLFEIGRELKWIDCMYLDDSTVFKSM